MSDDGRRYYELLVELSELLTSKGFGDWAQRLDHAERGGATGTEIVHRTGLVLEDLRKSPVAGDRDIRRGVEEARELARRLWRV
jgi:hypothetical protein